MTIKVYGADRCHKTQHYLRFLKEQNANIILGCSGWKNRFNIEDTLFAGAVIEEIKGDEGVDWMMHS